MCLAVYVSTKNPLPITERVNDKIGFHIRETLNYQKEVYQHFSKTFVYYLGSAEGCGCGFLIDGVYPEMPEYQAVRSSYSLLSEFLQQELEDQDLEIYALWGGEENKKPEIYKKIKLSDLANEDFAFEENHFYTIEP